MNKHVLPPNTREPSTGGDEHVQELPPPRSADAKGRKPEQPQAERPQRDKPEARKAGAGAHRSPDTLELNPLRRTYWTRRHLALAGVFVALIAGAIYWWPVGGSESRIVYSFTKVARGTVVVTLRGAGALEPRGSVDIVAPAGGRVESLMVKSGDRVSKGQSLAHLVSDTARADLASGEAERRARQADLVRAQIDVAEARAALTRARSETRPGAVDTAEARLARLSANADEARQLVQAAEQSVASARGLLAGLDVRAPFDGVVLKTDFEPSGDVPVIARGQPLVTLVPNLSEFDIRANFVESALAGLRAGARAEFTVPAYPQRVFAATLTALDLWPKSENRDGKQTVVYTATLTAANPEGVLRPGMSADVTVVTAEARDALVVPNSALAFAPPPRTEAKFPPMKMPAGAAHMGRVWVLANGNPEPRDIALGLSDERVTQVMSGSLREGEDVIVASFVPATR